MLPSEWIFTSISSRSLLLVSSFESNAWMAPIDLNLVEEDLWMPSFTWIGKLLKFGDPDIVSSLRNGEFTMSFPNTTSSLHSSGHNVAIASVMSQYPRLSINWFKQYHAISEMIYKLMRTMTVFITYLNLFQVVKSCPKIHGFPLRSVQMSMKTLFLQCYHLIRYTHVHSRCRLLICWNFLYCHLPYRK